MYSYNQVIRLFSCFAHTVFIHIIYSMFNLVHSCFPLNMCILVVLFEYDLLVVFTNLFSIVVFVHMTRSQIIIIINVSVT